MSSTDTLPFQLFPVGPNPTPSPKSTSFTVSPPANFPTDIWRKPATSSSSEPVKSFNAPIIYKSIPLSKFKRVRVTVSATWERLYDQGGLVCIFNTASEPKERKWIKTGFEFYNGEEFVSTVAADNWADWSLVQTGIHTNPTHPDQKVVTLEIEKNQKDGTLWIYIIDGEKKVPIREITWSLNEDLKTEIWVGVYAATPTVDGRNGKELKVSFEGWELELQ